MSKRATCQHAGQFDRSTEFVLDSRESKAKKNSIVACFDDRKEEAHQRVCALYTECCVSDTLFVQYIGSALAKHNICE